MKTTGYKAIGKYLIVSPKKVRYIANIVRKKSFVEAVAILETLPNKGAKYLRKVMKSAAANAISLNKKIDEGMLYIKELKIDDGPRMRRVWHRSRGRRDIWIKRMSHISVTVDEIARMGE